MKKKSGRGCMWGFLIAAAVLIILFRIALYDGIVAREYSVESDTVKEEHSYLILTDLHSTLYGKGQRELCEKIEAASEGRKIEAVFLVGDIVDDERDFLTVETLLSWLVPRYPCYYVTGNHEFVINYLDDVREDIKRCGVHVLSNESIYLGDGIMLHGVNDSNYLDVSETFDGALARFPTSDKHCDILLSHRPEHTELYKNHGFDIVVSGHAHGGQVRIPFILNGLLAPGQGLFPKYAGGKYDLGKTTLVVSRGLMKNSLPRVFNPPEIVFLNVIPK